MIPTKELLQHLNGYRILEGKQPLDSWKKSRSDLEALLSSYAEEPETEDEQDKRLMDTIMGEAEPSMSLNQQLDTLSDIIEQIVIPENDLTQADLDEQLQDENRGGPESEIPAENVPRVKSPRGAIGVMVMDLLQTDMPYKDIVKQVRDTYWDAKTTERSVASIAMDLRRDGVNVPARRKPAAIKLVVAATQASEVPEGLAN